MTAMGMTGNRDVKYEITRINRTSAHIIPPITDPTEYGIVHVPLDWQLSAEGGGVIFLGPMVTTTHDAPLEIKSGVKYGVFSGCNVSAMRIIGGGTCSCTVTSGNTAEKQMK